MLLGGSVVRGGKWSHGTSRNHNHRAPATEAVINRQLFSLSDSPETVQEDLAVELAHRQIRIATVIDELGAAAADGTINLPTPIQSDAVKPPLLKRLVFE
jgi:hypothetical protein